MNKRRLIGGGIIIIALAVAGFLFWFTKTAQDRTVQKIIAGPADGQLRTVEGEAKGNVATMLEGTVIKNQLVVTLPALPTGQSYHGWFFNPEEKQYRYAGAFYPLDNESYGLIFTTEEALVSYSTIVVTREEIDAPEAPGEIIVGGAVIGAAP